MARQNAVHAHKSSQNVCGRVYNDASMRAFVRMCEHICICASVHTNEHICACECWCMCACVRSCGSQCVCMCVYVCVLVYCG